MMWWGHAGGWAYGVMSVGMIAVWALIVWAVVAVRRPDSGHVENARSDPSGETPTAGGERILAERFARGEIDADEYRRRLADLNQEHLAETSS